MLNYKRQYIYDGKRDEYICPMGKTLTYRTTNRPGYRQYHSPQGQCADCPSRLLHAVAQLLFTSIFALIPPCFMAKAA